MHHDVRALAVVELNELAHEAHKLSEGDFVILVHVDVICDLLNDGGLQVLVLAVVFHKPVHGDVLLVPEAIDPGIVPGPAPVRLFDLLRELVGDVIVDLGHLELLDGLVDLRVQFFHFGCVIRAAQYFKKLNQLFVRLVLSEPLIDEFVVLLCCLLKLLEENQRQGWADVLFFLRFLKQVLNLDQLVLSLVQLLRQLVKSIDIHEQ